MKSLDECKGITFDVDGVWFRGDEFPDVAALKLLVAAERRGLKMTFASNGAGGQTALSQKFSRKGVEISRENIMTAGHATAEYLCKEQERLQEKLRVLFLGPEELMIECRRQSVDKRLFRDPLVFKNDVWDPSKKTWIAKKNPTHVVTARHEFNPSTVEAAAAAIKQGATWVATGMDHAITTESGDLRAGTGVLVSAIQKMLSNSDDHSQAAPIIMGKPDPRIVQYCLDQMGIPPELAIMFGDGIDTDMAVAKRLGMTRALVLSGVTSRQRAEKNADQFDYVFDDLEDFAKALRKK